MKAQFDRFIMDVVTLPLSPSIIPAIPLSSGQGKVSSLTASIKHNRRYHVTTDTPTLIQDRKKGRSERNMT